MASTAATPEPKASVDNGKALARYRDGYRVARTLNGLGETCKVVGLLIGIAAIFFAVMGSETLMRPNPYVTGIANYQTQHNLYLISAIVLGTIIAFIGWVIGVVVAGYGQQLKATLDAAVNTSPFLSDKQRAQMMSLT